MERKILVNADALARLLARVDPGGFQSGELGVGYEDDGSGIARRLVATSCPTGPMPSSEERQS